MGNFYSLPRGLKGVASPVATQIRNIEKRKVLLVKVPKTIVEEGKVPCSIRNWIFFKVKVTHINKLD